MVAVCRRLSTIKVTLLDADYLTYDSIGTYCLDAS